MKFAILIFQGASANTHFQRLIHRLNAFFGKPFKISVLHTYERYLEQTNIESCDLVPEVYTTCPFWS